MTCASVVSTGARLSLVVSRLRQQLAAPTLGPTLLAGALALALLATAAEARSFDAIRRSIEAEMEASGVPSLALAVLFNGEIVWEAGFGWADTEHEIPATPRTPFSLASVSKPITTTAVMILVERGQVELDRPVEEYLGGVRLATRGGDPREATVRRVASHTSGLPLHHRFFFATEPRPPLEETLGRYAFLARPPGSAQVYSNLGYRILDHLVETVSGEPFGRFLEEEVFAPLGMEDAALVSSPGNAALAVRHGRSGEPIPFYGTDHPGASEVFASARDLVRFAALHLGRPLPGQAEILSPRARHEMQRPVPPAGDDGRAFGIGWVVELDRRGPTVLSHTGGMPGTSAALMLVPARGLAVAVLAGTQSDLAPRVARRILRAYEPPSLRRGPSIVEPPPAGRPWRRRAPRRLAGAWEGTVVVNDDAIPASLELERSGEGLLAVGDAEPAPLRLTRFQRRSLRAWVAVRLPDPELEGRSHAVLLELTSNGRELTGVATALSHPAEPLPFALGHWVELRRNSGR
jgi:CubicO group peptidase (beta-lactamase class C family)